MPKPDRIAQVVAEYFGVNKDHVRSKMRTRDHLIARQIGMYLMLRLCGMTYQSIGDFYDRSHSTVMHACRKINRITEWEGPIHQAVNLLTMKLKAEDGEELKPKPLKYRG